MHNPTLEMLCVRLEARIINVYLDKLYLSSTHTQTPYILYFLQPTKFNAEKKIHKSQSTIDLLGGSGLVTLSLSPFLNIYFLFLNILHFSFKFKSLHKIKITMLCEMQYGNNIKPK